MMRLREVNGRPGAFVSGLLVLLLWGMHGLAAGQQLPVTGRGAISPQASTSSSGATSTKPANNTPLQAVATVNANVTVEAGLLPRDAAKQLFGGWVADRFAVVQITIGNHSRDQQFILQDVFFDYSHWALSGLYTAGQSNQTEIQFPAFQQGTKPGEIASIGALQVHDGLKSASVFSPRNTWVNGLVLVGVTAGGFAFLGPAGFTEAVTGYNSAMIPGLQKFWPDRSIDQQTNVLKYGFQDKMVIAKEDPGKTYAFFPIARFLTNGLAELFRKDPAIFFNPAELFLDPNLPNLATASGSSSGGKCGKAWSRSDCHQLIGIKQRLIDLVHSDPENSNLNETQILAALVSPCVPADPKKGGNPVPPDGCPGGPGRLQANQNLKTLMADASLNSVHIVVSGIMTVDVETIPAIISGVEFDNQKEGESLWSNTKDPETGVIKGRYLTNGRPVITAIKLPKADSCKPCSPSDPKAGQTKQKQEKTAPAAGSASATAEAGSEAPEDKSGSSTPKVDDYIDTKSLAAVEEGSSDAELHFSLKFKRTIPPGTILTFEVVKTSSKSVNDDGRGANTSETTASANYDYVVDYVESAKPAPPAAETSKPDIKDVNFKGATAASWATKGKEIAGTITGTDLKDGTVAIATMKVAGKTIEQVEKYARISPGPADSTPTTLHFTLTPSQAIAPGSSLTFTVTSKDKDGKTLTSNPSHPYVVPQAVGKKKPKSGRK